MYNKDIMQTLIVASGVPSQAA